MGCRRPGAWGVSYGVALHSVAPPWAIHPGSGCGRDERRAVNAAGRALSAFFRQVQCLDRMCNAESHFCDRGESVLSCRRVLAKTCCHLLLWVHCASQRHGMHTRRTCELSCRCTGAHAFGLHLRSCASPPTPPCQRARLPGQPNLVCAVRRPRGGARTTHQASRELGTRRQGWLAQGPGGTCMKGWGRGCATPAPVSAVSPRLSACNA
jgi:hypothetical protein